MTPQIKENSTSLSDALNNDSNKKNNNISTEATTTSTADNVCNGQGYVNQSFESNEKNLSTESTLKNVNGIGNSGEDGGGGFNFHHQQISSSEKTSEQSIVDFDDFLPHVGDFGKYQKILFLCMIPFAFFVAFVYFSQIFIALVPEEHWCHVPELSNLSANER